MVIISKSDHDEFPPASFVDEVEKYNIKTTKTIIIPNTIGAKQNNKIGIPTATNAKDFTILSM